MYNESKNTTPKNTKFSKDNPIIEISTKQSQTQNVVPPVKPKESKKE